MGNDIKDQREEGDKKRKDEERKRLRRGSSNCNANGGMRLS